MAKLWKQNKKFCFIFHLGMCDSLSDMCCLLKILCINLSLEHGRIKKLSMVNDTLKIKNCTWEIVRLLDLVNFLVQIEIRELNHIFLRC